MMRVIEWSTRSREVDGHESTLNTLIILKSQDGHFFYAIQEGHIANDAKIEVKDLLHIHEIPFEYVRPLYTEDLTQVPDPLPVNCCIKRPSLRDYDPSFNNYNHLSHLVLAEAKVYEILKKAPHPNVAEYLGCRVVDDRIHGFCSPCYDSTLRTYFRMFPVNKRTAPIFLGRLRSGVDHIHALGLAHNNLNPDSIMMHNGQPIIVGFGSCAPQGTSLTKMRDGVYSLKDAEYSEIQNDLYSLSMIERFLLERGDPVGERQHLSRQRMFVSASPCYQGIEWKPYSPV